ncbi:hypothetical protein D3C84_665200 [compost metagenome]
MGARITTPLASLSATPITCKRSVTVTSRVFRALAMAVRRADWEFMSIPRGTSSIREETL